MASGEFSTSLAFIFTTKSILYSVVNILRGNCVGDIRGFNPFPRDGVKMCPHLPLLLLVEINPPKAGLYFGI